MRRAASVPALVPLLAWPEHAKLAELNDERRALMHRITTLPPCSRRRTVLGIRLQDLTHRLLAAQTDLRRRLS